MINGATGSAICYYQNCKENEYHGRADGDSDSKIHLVFVCDRDSGDVLTSAGDDI
jgi:hypothetical protein